MSCDGLFGMLIVSIKNTSGLRLGSARVCPAGRDQTSRSFYSYLILGVKIESVPLLRSVPPIAAPYLKVLYPSPLSPLI